MTVVITLGRGSDCSVGAWQRAQMNKVEEGWDERPLHFMTAWMLPNPSLAIALESLALSF